MATPADTPAPPYYAVVFTSVRTHADDGYSDVADRMLELASQQPGYLGVESAHEAVGLGITVSYWASLEAIRAWRDQIEHRAAQTKGRSTWYRSYRLRVCRVVREGVFELDQ